MTRSGDDPASEEDYLLRRMRDSLAAAWSASDPLAKLAHFELSGRYSVAASALRRVD